MNRDKAGPLALQRYAILALLLLVASAAWAALLRQSAGGGMAMNSPTMGMTAPLFLAVWVLMMVAMMFPTAAPMILTFHRVQAGRRASGGAFVSTWVFVAAYMAVWALAGVVAYAGALAAEAVAAQPGLSAAAAARIGAGLLIVAGGYQLTPLKDVCLAKCRSPVGFIMTSWRDGTWGAVRMGLTHGLYCLGCCWLLFAILFPLGVMNLAAMAAITLVVFAEKALPWGRWPARATAAVLIAYGAVVLAAPQLLPTFSAPHAASMPTRMQMPAGGAMR